MLKNISSGKKLDIELVKLNNLVTKTLGMIRFKKSTAIFMKTRFGLHTFFLKKPIDIIIVDKHKKVIAAKKSLKPNNLFFWNPKYDCVLELPNNTIEKLDLKKEDMLEFNL